MTTATERLENAEYDLMAANRILAREDVVDGYGHVSLRHPDHPDRFLRAEVDGAAAGGH